MEKLSRGQPREWHYNLESTPSNVYFEALCCPCVVYGRADLRLKRAVAENKGKAVEEHAASWWMEPPDYPSMTSACCTYVFCLPGSACLTSSLRTKVRELYGIDGTKCRDFFESSCYPGETLIQIENEIILREQPRKVSESSATSGYQPSSPMTAPRTSSSSSRVTTKATTPSSESDDPLPCIPEDSCESLSTTNPSGPSSRRTSTSKRRERPIARDPVAPTDASLVHNHELVQDQKGPATYKSSPNHGLNDDTPSMLYPPAIHRLRDDTKALASPPAVDRSHDLFHDAKETHTIQPTKVHGIEWDPEVRGGRVSEKATHDIRQDETAPEAYPASASHHLHHDVVSPPARRPPRPHTLEADDGASNRPASRGPHHLQDDK
ncbi:hypothetical protein ACJ41O_010568 [Fusarium nematophilum]